MSQQKTDQDKLPCGCTPWTFKQGEYWGAFCMCGHSTGSTWDTEARALAALKNIVETRMKYDRPVDTHSEQK
jgi:hypothetical protein